MRPLCRDCWTDEYARTTGAHWSIDDPQRVWDVLRASDGELVADLSPLFMGGRPFVRVDGDANMTAVGPTLIDGGENDAGTPVIEEKIVRLESFDRDALFEAIETGRDPPRRHRIGHHPTDRGDAVRAVHWTGRELGESRAVVGMNPGSDDNKRAQIGFESQDERRSSSASPVLPH